MHIGEMALAWKIAWRLIPAAAVSALFMGTASAQSPTESPSQSPLMPSISLTPESRPLTPEEKEKREAIEDAYKSAIQKIPDQKKSADPWENVRPTTSSKAKQGQ